jgi:4-oxalocrotonate tautomerase family enzyme
MPFVHVHWFEGRSDEQKAEIARRIEAALIEVAGATPEHCWVKFSDSAKTDFIIGESAESPSGRAST